MATPTFAYGLVILPPPALRRQVMDLRSRHPLLQGTAPPHITVKSSFLYRGTGAWVVDVLDDVCSRFEPFTVECRGIGTFDQGVIYVRVEESLELRALHGALVEGLTGYVETLNDRFEGDGFVPHLTVADQVAREDITAARRVLSGFWPRWRFPVEQVHLLRGRYRWDIARSFALGA